jgi:hypothetical protein
MEFEKKKTKKQKNLKIEIETWFITLPGFQPFFYAHPTLIKTFINIKEG